MRQGCHALRCERGVAGNEHEPDKPPVSFASIATGVIGNA
jgi:hypothetical protein